MAVAVSLLVVLAAPSSAPAHPAISATALVKVRPDGRVEVSVSHDALAFALNDIPRKVSDAAMFDLLDADTDEQARILDDARDRFESQFELRADGNKLAAALREFPNVAILHDWLKANPQRVLPVRLVIIAESRVPPDTREISLRFPPVLGDLIATFDRPGEEPLGIPLLAGAFSPEVAIRLESTATRPHHAAPSAPDSFPAIAWRYAKLGYEHILGFDDDSWLPVGLDHCLFVLSLFLLTPRARTLVWQISAFTLAHTTTLTLTTFNLVNMSPRVIEPVIAASIAFVALENLVTTKVNKGRLAVAFAFGLVHGMGFASAMRETGLPTGQLVAGVLAFNVGVESGHMVVLAGAFALLGWWRHRPWYRARVAMPLSLGIGAVATYWTIERLFWPS